MKRQQGLVAARLSEPVGSLSRSCDRDWLCTGDLSWLFFRAFMGSCKCSLKALRDGDNLSTHRSLDPEAGFHRGRSGLASWYHFNWVIPGVRRCLGVSWQDKYGGPNPPAPLLQKPLQPLNQH